MLHVPAAHQEIEIRAAIPLCARLLHWVLLLAVGMYVIHSSKFSIAAYAGGSDPDLPMSYWRELRGRTFKRHFACPSTLRPSDFAQGNQAQGEHAQDQWRHSASSHLF